MDTVGERIKAIRQERGVTVRELAQSVALAPSTLYDLEQGDSAGTPKLPAIARALGVSAYWLQTGKGKRDSSMEPIAVADGPKPGYWTIPRFDVFMQMGVGEEAQHYGDEPDELPGNAFREDFCRAAGWRPSTHFSARVEGDSMIEAGLRSGWTVVVDTTPDAKRIVEGEIYALRENGSGLMCKFLQPQSDGGLHIISANSAHPIYRNPRRLSPEEAEHVEVLGRVVHAQGLLGRRF